MNRVRIGIGVVLSVAIGAAAAASAATEDLDGRLEGDGNSKVSARVVIEDGVPVRVNDLSFRKIDFRCESGQTLHGSVDAPDTVPVRKNGNFEASNEDIDIKGEVRRKGRKIAGRLEAELEFGGDRCEAKGDFKAR